MGRLTVRNFENETCCAVGGCIAYEDCYECPGFQDILAKLAHYEDLEESGRLVVLPCKVGETVYQILQKGSGHWEEDKYILDDRGIPKIYERGFHLILLNDIGKTVFLTRKEAEAALKGGGQDE